MKFCSRLYVIRSSKWHPINTLPNIKLALPIRNEQGGNPSFLKTIFNTSQGCGSLFLFYHVSVVKLCERKCFALQTEWLAHTGASVLAVFQRLMAGRRSGQPPPARAVGHRRRRSTPGLPASTGAACATSATAVRPSWGATKRCTTCSESSTSAPTVRVVTPGWRPSTSTWSVPTARTCPPGNSSSAFFFFCHLTSLWWLVLNSVVATFLKTTHMWWLGGWGIFWLISARVRIWNFGVTMAVFSTVAEWWSASPLLCLLRNARLKKPRLIYVNCDLPLGTPVASWNLLLFKTEMWVYF